MKTTLQFKLSFMFFMVMLISSTISVTVLLLIFSPIMRRNAETQLSEMAVSINALSEQFKDNSEYTPSKIVSLVTNSGFTVTNADANKRNISDNIEELEEKGYHIDSSGIIPKASMLVKVKGEYYLIDNFSNDSLYWIVNFVIILSFIGCIVIGTIITSFVGKTILQPLHEISRATSEVARGNFKVRVRVPDDIEYGMLANNFNKMAVQLSEIETLRGDFISSVSHEFKTPLASIQGFAKLLQDDTISEEDRKEYTQIIIDETSRLTKLSTNILSLTKLENQKTIGKKSKFLLDEQMRNILLILEPEWSKKNIELDIDLEQITYIGNEELMAQIWQNIINNAIKFTGEGGHIGVKLYRGDQCIVAKISDDGPSIPDEKRKKIFEKFYQGDHSRSTDGNGLGLALVQRVVELCNGSVWVENTMPTGVCFTVQLPYIIEDMM
ncbi:MAG: HAMP domain-containing histidine kinase [Ruminococcus sp.]|nr:HAMP domain-containing histidine kinase [Ruminococcus sp.]